MVGEHQAAKLAESVGAGGVDVSINAKNPAMIRTEEKDINRKDSSIKFFR
jgi:hypothetical protein